MTWLLLISTIITKLLAPHMTWLLLRSAIITNLLTFPLNTDHSVDFIQHLTSQAASFEILWPVSIWMHLMIDLHWKLEHTSKLHRNPTLSLPILKTQFNLFYLFVCVLSPFAPGWWWNIYHYVNCVYDVHVHCILSWRGDPCTQEGTDQHFQNPMGVGIAHYNLATPGGNTLEVRPLTA